MRKVEKKKDHIYLYLWHFLPDHRRRKYDELWELIFAKGENQKFYDLERNKYLYPLPHYLPQQFIEDEFSVTYVRPQD